jgi:hypothetical protein
MSKTEHANARAARAALLVKDARTLLSRITGVDDDVWDAVQAAMAECDLAWARLRRRARATAPSAPTPEIQP